jgi:thiaminase
MVAFTDRLVEANRAVWAAMAGHPFVLGLAHGTLPHSALQAWVQQDRIFVMGLYATKRGWRPRSLAVR